tara:strand:+ start:268 stop:1050 length:783 start_codon:yes stop_codon:yes gene_type:complete
MKLFKETSMAILGLSVASAAFGGYGNWGSWGGMDYYEPYNECVNKTKSNVKVLDGWGGNGEGVGQRCVHVSSLRTFSGSVLAQFGMGAFGDDIENGLNDVLDANTEYVCSNGVGGAGFGSASANINSLSLQTCNQHDTGKAINDGAKITDDYIPGNYCLNRSHASVKTLIGTGGDGFSGGTSCFQKSDLTNVDLNIIAQGYMGADDDIDLQGTNISSPSVRFLCLNGSGGAGFGAGSGNVSATAIQTCDIDVMDDGEDEN